MNGRTILQDAKDRLADEVLGTAIAVPEPLAVSPWVAMSLLQKAIRRSETALALQAAVTLLQLSPERLWRRIGCVAFEDVGVAELEWLSVTTAALSGKRYRTSIGSEWQIASYLVSRMSQGSQCRSADDLLLTAELHPRYRRARSELAGKSTADLLRIVSGSADLPVRAIAAWYAIGTDRRPSPYLFERKGDPGALFDWMCEAGLPHTVVEISREGFRRVGEVLCPFVALLSSTHLPAQLPTEADTFPPEVLIGDGIPSWAFDMYTREGRAAYQAFLRGNSQSAKWVRTFVPKPERVQFLGTAIFRVEGGLVKNRLRWDTGDWLKRSVDIECHGPRCSDATELLALVRADIPSINEARAAHVG
ncbi:hypothetical protein YH63_008330 [Afipia massiliensis]|uniref:Uncharacterized protein n=1 Tax=Afipia massiliensis TaxID=211460 RepID=A0A4U6BQZ5_9BRAD|nr:hypothetical protein [Afipia massiliensis]TKT71418.1 hypothetical protein YH63_008330 [Afipia massiliensis]